MVDREWSGVFVENPLSEVNGPIIYPQSVHMYSWQVRHLLASTGLSMFPQPRVTVSLSWQKRKSVVDKEGRLCSTALPEASVRGKLL